MTYLAGTPSWTDLMTPSPEDAHRFYSALFGWTFEIGGPEYGHYAVAFQDGKSAAGIGPMPAGMPAGINVPSVWTVYFASDDLAADAGRVRALGGSVMVEPMQVGDRGQMGVFSDPTGAAFGLWQAGSFGGAESQGDVGSVVWVEVNTRDSARALAFYTGLLHARSVPVADMDYHQLLMNDQAHAGVSGFGEHWEAVIPNHWVTYFYVPDVHQAARTAEANGGKVLVQPFEMAFGAMAVLADPGGASFSVMTPAQRSE